MQLYGDIFWLIVIIILCVIEGMTFGIVCIWFAGGAVAALISSALGFGVSIQYTVFVLISAFLLFFTRPIIVKFLNTKKTLTNADRLVGMTGVVIIGIDPILGQGQVKVDGEIWSAKSQDGSVIGEGNDVEINDISGVKLVVSLHTKK
jgi:membrane protein implicated in regulation of membrane protease activity